MNTDDGSRIALFIDFENLVTRTGLTAETFDLQPVLDRLLAKGKVVFRRAYCDWQRFAGAKRNLHERGVELIEVPPSTSAGKNGADMRLVIDALELAYQRGHVDTFAIASGDSDFCPLAYKLRENNRTVIGVAVKEATSPLFVKACDEFMYIVPTGSKPKASANTTKTHVADKPPREIPSFVREVTTTLLADATGPINPSVLKQAIVRKAPDFDERTHGFSTFTRMLEAMEKEGLLKREQSSKGQWHVLPPS